MRAFLILGLLLLPGAALGAETVTCADAAGEVSLIYKIDAAAAQPILSVAMQLSGDFGVATEPAHEDHDGEYISAGYAGDGFEGGDVSWRDERRQDHLTVRFRIGRVSEARKQMIGGVLAVGGGGLWTVTCEAEDTGG